MINITLDIYNLIVKWKDCTFLQDEKLEYDSEIYCQSLIEFRHDYLRWFAEDEIDMSKLIMTPQLHAILTYRIANKYYLKGMEDQAQILSLIGRNNSQIEIYYSSLIGQGIKVNHGGGSVIGARCKIGNNCTIHQNVTLGDKNGGRPIVGNNVVVYPGAIILGKIIIGDNSIIGANSVVFQSFDKDSIIVGVPAKNIKK